MRPVPTIRERVCAYALLLAAALALQLPWWGRPFGDSDLNAGGWFGLFLRYFERFGFGTLHGTPLASLVAGHAADPFADAIPYVNHPPGLTWLLWLAGTSETAMRAPTQLLWLLASVCLFELLRARFAAPWAAGGALVHLALPSNAVLCQVSYETAVLGFGLPLLLATERLAAARGRAAFAWRGLQFAAAFLGTWMDWSFAFVCAAAAVLARGRPRLLLAPVAGGALALLAYWLWLRGALPLFRHRPPGADLAALVREHVLGNRPPPGEFFAGAGKYLALANTALVPLLALPGLALLLRRDAALAAALLLVAFLHPLTFAHHATSHFHFWGYLGPLLGAAFAAHATLRPGWLRALGALVVAAAVTAAALGSIDAQRRNDTTLFRDVAATLARAAAGDGGARWLVGHNFPQVYAYYVREPEVVVTYVAEPRAVEGGRRVHPLGVRYLHVQLSADAMRYPTDPPALRSYLAPFPRERVPALEREFWQIDGQAPARIEAAWLYTLPR
jgi:hypothetical protein